LSEEIRLQKYLAAHGIASRRRSEDLIKAGNVSVDGRIVTEPGTKISGNEKITVNGKQVKKEVKKYYIVINKPTGVVSSSKPERDLPCVVDLITDIDARLFPVGRLDADTSGMLLITNDGDFTQKLTHPSNEVWKTYEALVKGNPDEHDIQKFEKGVELEDGVTLPASLEVIGYKGKNSLVEILIREGRNRQIRRMFDALGHPVIYLKRIRIAGLDLGDLRPGEWRRLKSSDLKRLFGEE
jgi:23S rRNA pseudouridine2605 synthase